MVQKADSWGKDESNKARTRPAHYAQHYGRGQAEDKLEGGGRRRSRLQYRRLWIASDREPSRSIDLDEAVVHGAALIDSIDTHGKIIEGNARASSLLGYSNNEEMGNT